jgi:dolichyl-diphosphooligosaccharide--protein glycosyltransferase
MKWLKKDSSDNEQISNAESQPEPEQPSGHAANANSAPEPVTLEQPVVETVQTSPETADVFETEETAENFGQETQISKQTARRRDQKSGKDKASEKIEAKKQRKSLKNTWIGQNWKTFAILMAIFCLAFFARAYYGLEPATEDGFILSGGSDSYYHNYVITHADETGEHHFWDNMLNYPVGTRNPRPPLYDWSVSLMGLGLSPFFDGDTYTSTFYAFIFSTAFWGALTIFPTYYLGKEAFGKKAGIIAALLLGIMPGHIQRSVLTNADHDAITLFFMVTGFFFFLKALKVLEQREWIASWSKPKEIWSGSKTFFMANKVSLLYGVLAGFSFAAVALIWQGFAYAIVLVSVYFGVQILLNRFRNIDSFGISMVYLVSVGIGLLFAFPYYYISIQISSWFDTPSILFIGLFAFSLILIVTRKYPWLLVFSALSLITLASVLILWVLAPSVLDTIVNALLSGGGYFINNKQYQTIAEAQAPPFSNLALSFGIITFWLSFVGIAWAAIQLPKSWKPDFTFILLWSGTSIYMAVTAARFMFNAGPAFAITSGWVIALIIEKINFKSYVDNLKRASRPNMSHRFLLILTGAIAVVLTFTLVLSMVSNLALPVFVIGITAICGIYMLNLISETNPNRMYSLLTVMVPASAAMFYIYSELFTDWNLTDSTHGFIMTILLLSYFVLYVQVRRTSFFFTGGIMFLVLCIVTPNVWAGLDAGIPYETKTGYDKEIYLSMPIFMQPKSYDAINGTTWFLGGFGYSLPLNSRYWPAAYDWLATQDENIYPPHDRPAFLSWWDYGFEIVNEGKHPTVADNFLGGHQLAGNFIMAQSEADAIALLCIRILEGNWVSPSHAKLYHFDPEIISLMEANGVDSAEMQHIFDSPLDYIDTILENPQKYGPRDDEIQAANARYITSRVLLKDAMDEEGIVQFYSDLQSITGHSIRYFGIDSRLFPFSADNTGIFYAPAKLSDHRIDDIANQPYDFWEIKAVGEYGGEYSLDDIPNDVKLNQDTPYKLIYKDMFYNSMLYKAFIGYSGSDIGSEEGVPGLSQSLSDSPIMPGWNMTHFKLVHRTAYWNPYSAENIQDHTDAWRAMNFWDAYKKQQMGEGISDLSDRSSIYQGVMILKYYDGAIISGQATLKDGTPVEGLTVAVSDEFEIPHQKVKTAKDGSYSIIAPPGNVTLTLSSGTIDPLTFKGMVLNTTHLLIQDYQAMRENEDRNTDGIPDYLIKQNLVVSGGSIKGTAFWDYDSDGALGDGDETIANAKITIKNDELNFGSSTHTDLSGEYQFDIMVPGSYSANIILANQSIGNQILSITSDQTSDTNLPLTATPVRGTVTYSDGYAASNAAVVLRMLEENIEVVSYSDSNGNYVFKNLIKGNYTAQAFIYEFASTQQRVNIDPLKNNTVDFVIFESRYLHGTVLVNGIPVPYATIKFAGPSSSIAMTDSSGHYSVILNNGEYTYYVSYIIDNLSYSTLGTISLVEDGTLNLNLKLSCMVKGKITDFYGDDSSYTQVVFDTLDQQVYLSAITDYYGDYTITLPQGKYRVQVSSKLTGSYYNFHYLTTNTQTLNINLKKGVSVSGYVFWDLIENDIIDNNEGIQGARVTFMDTSGTYAQALTDETGNYSITLPPATSYQVYISKTGFKTATLGTFTPSQLSTNLNQALDPYQIPISGTVFKDDEPLTDQNIHVSFVSGYEHLPSYEIQVGRDGYYSGALLPGIYTVSFTHNVSIGNDTLVYQIDKEMIMDTGLFKGKSILLNFTAVQRTKVNVSLTNALNTGTNVSFKMGPEDLFIDMDDLSESVYIQPGTYILSATQAINDTFMVGIVEATVSEEFRSYEIRLEEGIFVTGTITYSGEGAANQKVIFKDIVNNATISVNSNETGYYSAILAPGRQYNAIVNFTGFDEEPYLRAYRYYSEPRIINATKTLSNLPIILHKENISIAVNGVVSFEGNPAPYTDITFIATFGNYSVTSNSAGQYSILLPPAQYFVYAHQRSSNYVHFKEAFIDLEQVSLDITLVKGYRIYGSVYYDLNNNIKTNLFFTSEDGNKMVNATDENGYYEMWLPLGLYTIISDTTILKEGVHIPYTLNYDLDLRSDRQINLPLTMVEERIVFIYYDPSQLEKVSVNTSVTYKFEVENNGNIRDTYDISAIGGTPDWTTELSQTKVTLDPEKKITLAVTVSVPKNARVDQNQLTLTAVSEKNHTIRHSNIMNLLIIQNYDFRIEPAAISPKFSEGNINSQFNVVNKGNGVDKITLYIANNEDLAINGWSAQLGAIQGSELKSDASMLFNVSLSIGSSTSVPIYLKPISDVPSRQTKVLIVGYSQHDNNVITSEYIVLKYPELQITSQNLTISGMEISSEPTGDQLTNTGVMIASVASALLIFYYARKKRWIR